ncbi:MAG: YiiX/YebB-like N1pC/P60 family cysteine hydrolase [Gemmatimonadales bacterium]
MKTVAVVAGALAAVFLLLSLPPAEPTVGPAPAHDRSFAWRQDALWQALEARYVAARAAGCDGTADVTMRHIGVVRAAVETLFDTPVAPRDATLDSLEARFFALAPAVAACPRFLHDYLRLSSRMREAIKWQSRRWDVSRVEARDRLYRALYGGRAAVEEAMLQHPDSLDQGVWQSAEPSATPAADVHGVTIHSGDILVSRGGYPTSALIARGNDYPGNFSHIGLVHVDSPSHAVSVIEAHIEQGVAVATAEQYLRDKKLRLMVLRPRADLPQLTRDPLLPHRAASLALERARAGHIPYDFEMDYTDPSRVFCSEVASWVYRELGVNLWMGISTISKPGLRRWLASFGVQHFETQEPSDLEYDPQLVVVAEWRDAASLFQDHIDNAVIDAMLEGAERGDRLGFPWYALPAARVGKAVSWSLERFGRTGPVPEGMSAAAALRNKAFSDRERRLAQRVSERAARLTRERGYPPPYWALLDLAREVARPTTGSP